MLLGKRVLAVVPARSGSKGITDKNMRPLAGRSLIGRAGDCLAALDWLDGRVISTDSQRYADEGQACGLDAPFMRPDEIASDRATALDTMVHALAESERHYGGVFDILLYIEPTSPLREPQDIEGAARLLIESEADSVVCVSPASTKCHPLKMLDIVDERLTHYESAGDRVTARQQLSTLYVRNGVCYGFSRECLLESKGIVTDNTRPYVIDRELANIDDPIDFEWAEFLLSRANGRSV